MGQQQRAPHPGFLIGNDGGYDSEAFISVFLLWRATAESVYAFPTVVLLMWRQWVKGVNLLVILVG